MQKMGVGFFFSLKKSVKLTNNFGKKKWKSIACLMPRVKIDQVIITSRYYVAIKKNIWKLVFFSVGESSLAFWMARYFERKQSCRWSLSINSFKLHLCIKKSFFPIGFHRIFKKFHAICTDVTATRKDDLSQHVFCPCYNLNSDLFICYVFLIEN